MYISLQSVDCGNLDRVALLRNKIRLQSFERVDGIEFLLLQSRNKLFLFSVEGTHSLALHAK